MKKITIFTLLLTFLSFGMNGQEGLTKLQFSMAEGGGFPGCLNPTSCNYDAAADFDDGSCEFPGCLDEAACNFSPLADCEGECFYTFDCNGVCGGIYVENECQCFNPNFGDYEVSEVPFMYAAAYADLPAYTTYTLSDDDMVEAPITFDFPFFGLIYSELWISSNGFVSFSNLGDDDGCCQGEPMPTMDNIMGAGIAPNWADYYSEEEGIVYTAGDGSFFMIGFDGVPSCCGTENYSSWQLVLYPDGSFTMNIDTVDGNENIHVIGFQDGEGAQGEMLYYEPFLQLSEVAYHVAVVQEPEACLPGCTDEQAFNFSFEASEDDGSCLYFSNCDNIVDVDGNGADFHNYYAPDNWTFENIGGLGLIDHTSEYLFIEGSNTEPGKLFGGGGEVLTQATILASATGTYSFNWDYSTDDESANFDIGYYINNVRIDLTNVDGDLVQNGFISFEANEGDLIGFGIDATDDCCGAGFLEVTNFRYPFVCVGTCFNPSADNYDIEGDFYDFYSCVWTNECGQETDSNGNGSFFGGDFAPEFWTEVNEGDGVIELFEDEEGVFAGLGIQGSNASEGTDVNTGWTIIAPVSGTYSFAWNYGTEDETSLNDPAYYFHNGITILTEEFDQFGELIGSGSQSGWIQFEVVAGDEIGFGVLSVNECCGVGFLDIFAFAWPIDCAGGCMDETALNYNPSADYDNEWCAFMSECDVVVNANGDLINFIGDFAPELWEVLSEGDGLVEIEEAQIEIWGSDTNEEEGEVLTEATIEIIVGGTYSFDWTYFTIDGAEYDIAYFINDERTDLTLEEDIEGNSFGNSGQSGSISLELTAGTILGFGIEATDDCCGLGTLTINHFTHPAPFCAAGCTDEEACNYDSEANFDNSSCEFETCAGCMDPTACNYDEEATIEDGSCEFEACSGCMDETACNYNEEATIEDESCEFETCAGCMDETACNFNEEATIEDESCEFETCSGCMDETACNFNEEATIEDESCEFETCSGCMDETACNYDEEATIEDESCEFETCAGCMDETACNYNEEATIEDESCEFETCAGCMDETACNYNEEATIEDESCEYETCAGCMDETACNFNEEATIEDASCEYETCAGCMDETACNYNEEATIEDESCEYETCAGCMDQQALNYDADATIDSEDCIYECELPEVTFEVANCEQGEFTVEIAISSIGNGAPYTISNSIDGVTETVDEAGDLSYGGFPIDQTVVITIVSAFGDVCIITSGEIGCPIGIDENAVQSLLVYPNPANNNVTIAADLNELVKIELFDIAGRMTLTYSTVLNRQGFTFNVSALAEGSYVVRILTTEGILTERIVIQH